MHYGVNMITLVGVGHVFRLEKAIKKIIFEQRPDAICLELDEERLTGLLSKSRATSAGITYKTLGDFQSRIADKYGTTVGSEMLAAYDASRSLNVPVYCIDMKASEFFERALKSMSLREKASLFFGSITARFAARRKIEEELARFEENDDLYIKEFEKKFPRLKHVLIDERNEHMASALRDLSTKHANIVALVGDGHVEGIFRLLSGLQVRAIRLKELRELEEKLEASEGTGNSQVSFSFIYSCIM